MAGEELQIVRLKDDFYRDGFYKALTALVIIGIAIASLIALCLYLYLAKPAPVYFIADNEWRIVSPVPLNKPYLKQADMVQWVSEVIPATLTYDFVYYTKQLKAASENFTPAGWQKMLLQLNSFFNPTTIQDSKIFVRSSPAGAPFVVTQGLLDGRYAWWVQIPIKFDYKVLGAGWRSTSFDLQVLVVRVSTYDNLNGVRIENVTRVAPKKQGGKDASPDNEG